MTDEATTRRQRRTASALAELGDYESGHNAPVRATAEAMTRASNARTLLLVEGISDQIAMEVLAGRLDRDLELERIVVVPIGGAQAISKAVEAANSSRLGRTARLIGLCDAAEQHVFASAFERRDPSQNRFFVCDPDLEAELIRAFGRDALEAVLEAAGDLDSFRTMQKQPHWIDQPFDQQMHRWIRSHARRSSRYVKILLDASPVDRIPQPLIAALDATVQVS